jgi:hypothetical protein
MQVMAGFRKPSFAHGLASDGKSSGFPFHNPLSEAARKVTMI